MGTEFWDGEARGDLEYAGFMLEDGGLCGRDVERSVHGDGIGKERYAD